ncbi:putative branched-chain-amino-acid aminotransferase 7 [Arachis ipaensis]|uniref:putative branched-chain-amino-acid aminotransferase 7 n=1 Tax=Arachis ipaensis TaxID=130454 RepID=UPI0007AFD298|nr:putative branched-chain-amino-acid aminotransferase 7 [Arachis ipaensis]
MKCEKGEKFSHGNLIRYGTFDVSPAAGILNYRQGIFEGLKEYRTEERSILLFRPEENALRMKAGADRLCMTSPSVEQFIKAVKDTVLANKCWVPPAGRGTLYLRPLLMGTGATLGVGLSTEYTFLIYCSPVSNYHKKRWLDPAGLCCNGHGSGNGVGGDKNGNWNGGENGGGKPRVS